MPRKPRRPQKLHPLKRYCLDHDLNQRELADKVGFSEGFISQLINGHERCGAGAARTFHEKLDGAVDIGELVTWPTRADGAAA